MATSNKFAVLDEVEDKKYLVVSDKTQSKTKGKKAPRKRPRNLRKRSHPTLLRHRATRNQPLLSQLDRSR